MEQETRNEQETISELETAGEQETVRKQETVKEPSKNTLKYVCIGLAAVVIVLAVMVAFLLGQRSGEKKSAGNTQAPPTASASAADSLPATESAAPASNAVSELPSAAETQAAEAATPAVDAPRNLEIDMAAGDLAIVKGEAFHVQFDDSVVNVSTDGNTMTIKTTPNHPTASQRRKMNVTVTVPETYAFSDVEIEVGAGKMTVHTLRAETLELELGAGNVTMDNLYVSGSATVEEGAGNLSIKGGEISNLTLQCGAGRASVNAKLIGSSQIDAAAGMVDLDLKGTQADYTVTFSIGLGACYYNNDKLARSGSFGEGQNHVTVNGGLGMMRVDVG